MQPQSCTFRARGRSLLPAEHQGQQGMCSSWSPASCKGELLQPKQVPRSGDCCVFIAALSAQANKGKGAGLRVPPPAQVPSAARLVCSDGEFCHDLLSRWEKLNQIRLPYEWDSVDACKDCSVTLGLASPRGTDGTQDAKWHQCYHRSREREILSASGCSGPQTVALRDLFRPEWFFTGEMSY